MSDLTPIDPFAELAALQKRFFGDDWMTPAKEINLPTTDLYMKGDNMVVEVHLPNFTQDDVAIHVENGVLVISAEKHEQEEDKNKKYVVRESSSSFYRRIALPDRANAEKIKAHLDDGVLKVEVPVAPLPEPKKISISTTSAAAKKK